MKPAAVLWTGGKDSALALHAAAAHGCEARCLVTFAPPEPDFLAHPLPVMALQARSLGLPHRVLTVAKPFETGYEAALRTLRDEAGIECVVTGDIAAVDGRPTGSPSAAMPSACRRACRSGAAIAKRCWGNCWKPDSGSGFPASIPKDSMRIGSAGSSTPKPSPDCAVSTSGTVWICAARTANTTRGG